MKKIRRTISIMLATALLITGLDYVPAEAATTIYTSGSYSYTLNEEDEATITKYSGNDSYVDIPDTLDGKAVVEIGREAFSGCSELETVDIPSGVTIIGYRAFANTDLQSLELPSGLEELGYQVLDGVEDVTTIVIPASLKKIVHYGGNGDGPFAGSNIQKVVFEKGITKIPNEVMRHNSKLRSVTLPDTVVEIGHEAFSGCSELETVDIPSGVTIIGYRAFANTDLQSLELPSVLEELGYQMLDGVEDVTTIVIPASLKTTDHYGGNGDGPFAGSNIQKVVFEKGIMKIPNEIMRHNSKLRSVTLPNTVVEIGHEAFSGCSELETVDIPSGVTIIGYRAFANTDLQSLELPSVLEELGYQVLDGVEDITTIVIPASLKKTVHYGGNGDGPFAGSNISKITFEMGLKKIPADLCCGASKLREVTFLDEMTSIGSSAFSGCTNLRSIELPISMNTIGSSAFSGCSNLSEVLADKKIKSVADNAFRDCSNVMIKVAKYTESMKSFVNAEQNLEFTNLEYQDTSDKVIRHEKSAYEINGSSVTNYVTMNLDYEVKQKEIKNAKDMKLVVKLPSSSDVMYIRLDGAMLSENEYQISSKNVITIPVTKSTGKCRIYITPNIDGRINSYAELQYKKDGVLCSDIIGAVSEVCTCFTLGTADEVSYEAGAGSVDIDVSGYGMKGKNVEIYVDGVLTKEITVSDTRKYSTGITLEQPENFKKYMLKLVSVDKSGNEVELSKQITTLENGPKLLGASLTIEAHAYSGGSKTIDLLNSDGSMRYITFQPGQPYRFSIQYENADKISRVFVISKRSGYSQKLEAKWDEEAKAYVTDGFFGNNSSYVPGTISIEYVAKPDGGTFVDENDNVVLTDEEKSLIPKNWKEATAEQVTDTDSDYEAEITLKSGDIVEYAYDKMTLTEYAQELEKKQQESAGAEAEISTYSSESETAGDIIDFLKVFDQEGTVKDFGKLYDFFEKDGFSRYTTGEGDLAKDISLIKTEINADSIRMYLFDPSSVDNTVARYIIKKGKSTTQKTILDLMEIDSSTGSFMIDSANSIFSFEGNMINLLWMKQEVMCDPSLSPAQREAKLKEIQKMADIAAEKLVFTYIAGVIGLIGAMAVPFSGVAIGCALTALTIKKCIIPMIESGDFDDFLNGKISLADMILKWIIDPSGYVYEGVLDNRITGATATLYYKENETDKTGTLWKASEYDQENPLTTDEKGAYAWDVPEGYWQVKVEKEGYETAYSEWMEVPPPQTDVNIEMVPLAEPELDQFYCYETFAKVTFSQYMDPDTVSNLIVKDSKENQISYTLSYDKSATDAKGNIYAKEFTLLYDNPVDRGEEVSLAGVESIVSSAGKALKAAAKTDEVREDVAIECNDYVNLAYGDSYELSVEVSGDAEGSLSALVDNQKVVKITKIEENDGNYIIKIQGLVYGEALLTLEVEKSGVRKNVDILVGQETSSGKNVYDMEEENPTPTPTPTVTPLPTSTPLPAATPAVTPTAIPTATPIPTPQSTAKPMDIPNPGISGDTVSLPVNQGKNDTRVNTGNETNTNPAINGTQAAESNLFKQTVKITKVKSAGRGKIKIVWKKAGGATGYQVQYALNKKFKKAKYKNCKALSATIKKLKKKKKYFVRVRAYRNIAGRKVYGKWSGTRKVFIKN